MTPSSVRAGVDQLVELNLAGVVTVRVSPGTQTRYAHLLADGAGRSIVALRELDPSKLSRVTVIAGLPSQRAEAIESLARFNGMRDLLHARGVLTVLVLDRWELAEMQRYAGDAYSAQLFGEDIAFEPDASVSVEDARASLTAWQRERLGRLDLRGFVRAEHEDVAWRVEDIYQDLEASATHLAGGERVAPGFSDQKLATWLDERDEGLVVVLGHPGSGKTFFLRWLALSMGASERVARVERPIPVLLSLAAFVTTPGPITLFDYAVETLLREGLAIANVFGAEADAGRVVFLLDGIDEVGDASLRARVASAIHALAERAPRCRIIATSRIAGYDGEAYATALQLTLSPFGDAAIERFLVRWCEMYAVDREGDTQVAHRRGSDEGAALAKDVLTHSEVRTLAGTPLLLTVIAIVHRTGVRLPDHRVELYDHATRILVERWNRVRNIAADAPAPPLKTTDAVRMLGPVALDMISSGTHGVIREERLRQLLAQSLKGGALRGLTTDDAIALFRNTLGLLVEQGPELYAFMHLTLAEYFAAWELVRTDALETLAAQENKAFRAEWREVILLSLGVLGVLRGDDARMEQVTRRLMQSASRRKGTPSPVVPSLFGTLLADDPGLSEELCEDVVNFLVPTWWFERKYSAPWSLEEVVDEARRLVFKRIRGQQVRGTLRRAVLCAYGKGPTQRLKESLSRSSEATRAFLAFLLSLDVDDGPSQWAFRGSLKLRGPSDLPMFDVEIVDGAVEFEILMSRWLYQETHAGRVHARATQLYRWRNSKIESRPCEGELRDATLSGRGSDGYLLLRCGVRLTTSEEFANSSVANECWWLHVELSSAEDSQP